MQFQSLTCQQGKIRKTTMDEAQLNTGPTPIHGKEANPRIDRQIAVFTCQMPGGDLERKFQTDLGVMGPMLVHNKERAMPQGRPEGYQN